MPECLQIYVAETGDTLLNARNEAEIEQHIRRFGHLHDISESEIDKCYALAQGEREGFS